MKVYFNNSELVFASKQTLVIPFTAHATWKDDGTWFVTTDSSTSTYKIYGANPTLVNISSLQGFTAHFPTGFRLKFKYFDADGSILRYDTNSDSSYANTSDVYSRAMARFSSATVVSGKESVTTFSKLAILINSLNSDTYPMTQDICDAVYFD